MSRRYLNYHRDRTPSWIRRFKLLHHPSFTIDKVLKFTTLAVSIISVIHQLDHRSHLVFSLIFYVCDCVHQIWVQLFRISGLLLGHQLLNQVQVQVQSLSQRKMESKYRFNTMFCTMFALTSKLTKVIRLNLFIFLWPSLIEKWQASYKWCSPSKIIFCWQFLEVTGRQDFTLAKVQQLGKQQSAIQLPCPHADGKP